MLTVPPKSKEFFFALRLICIPFLSLSFSFGLLPASSASQGQSPWSNISMNSTNAQAGDTLQMTFKDLVSETGVTSIDLYFISPSETNTQFVHTRNSFILISGTVYSGTWRTDFKVPETAEMGTWTTYAWVYESNIHAITNNRGPDIHVGPLTTVTPPIAVNDSWITLNLSSMVSNSQIGNTGLDVCGYHFTPGFLIENQSIACDKSFFIDLGQFFASTSGVVQQDFSLCGILIRAGTTVGFGVMLNCVSPTDKAAADKAAADKAAADKAAADKAAADKAAADKAADAVKITSVKKITITCIKGKLTKTVTAVKPVCPPGYKKK
jgi:hypothetical protein